MLFNSVEFIFLFLPVALAGTYLLASHASRNLAMVWLTACSLFYYGWFKPEYILLIGTSVVVNYVLGERIMISRETMHYPAAKRWLVSGLCFNLSLLGWFKYANFFVDNAAFLTGNQWSLPQILLPIGISFFTFQKIAYLMDCHDGKAYRTNFLKYSLFVFYFPQLIAGPIVHPNAILPQFDDPSTLRFRTHRLLEGLTIFLLGLSKKVVLADPLGAWATEGFSAAGAGASLSLLEAWGAALSYTLQIYFDFSGYSDMAIGLGWMFGIRLPINFHSPYKATSIIHFWRTWHITLSSFLRDYLYIPLGGNRKGQARRWFNLFTTMLLGGLWHGAGWTFVIWGGLHGLFLAINHFWTDFRRRVPPLDRSFGILGTVAAWSLTMLAVMVAWVFFRAPDIDTALRILAGMAGLNGTALPAEFSGPLAFLPDWVKWVPKLPYLAGGLRIGLAEMAGFLITAIAIAVLGKPLHEISIRTRYLLLIPSLALTLQKVLVSTEASEFLYFQF